MRPRLLSRSHRANGSFIRHRAGAGRRPAPPLTAAFPAPSMLPPVGARHRFRIRAERHRAEEREQVQATRAARAPRACHFSASIHGWSSSLRAVSSVLCSDSPCPAGKGRQQEPLRHGEPGRVRRYGLDHVSTRWTLTCSTFKKALACAQTDSSGPFAAAAGPARNGGQQSRPVRCLCWRARNRPRPEMAWSQGEGSGKRPTR